jgi:hypothetical protein
MLASRPACLLFNTEQIADYFNILVGSGCQPDGWRFTFWETGAKSQPTHFQNRGGTTLT